MKAQGVRGIVQVALVFYLLCPANIIGLWWAVGSPLVMDPNTICRKSRRLGGKQREICLNEPEIVQEVANGAKMAIAECQFQFQDRRWNCTTAHRALAKVLRKATREAAFVRAISAAAAVHAVTQACSLGQLLQCACDHTIRDKANDGEWEWGGCNDDVNFGYLKSRDFMDVVKKRRRSDLITRTRLHNNEAGRLTVKRHMRRDCKCHGLSGSCTLKTCWRRMPLFRDIGRRLKERFDGAAQVTISNDGKRLEPPQDTSIKSPESEDLVYSEESPDYCVFNKKVGSLGTRDRKCDPKYMGVGGCDLLCCDQGHRSEQVTVYENCRCRFQWCCEVHCQTCLYTRTEHKCL